MPKLSEIYKSKELTLPYSKTKATVKWEYSANEQMDIRQAKEGLELMVAMAAGAILKWEFQDEDGSPLVINKENIQKIPGADLAGIMSFVLKRAKEEKAGQEDPFAELASEIDTEVVTPTDNNPEAIEEIVAAEEIK